MYAVHSSKVADFTSSLATSAGTGSTFIAYRLVRVARLELPHHVVYPGLLYIPAFGIGMLALMNPASYSRAFSTLTDINDECA